MDIYPLGGKAAVKKLVPANKFLPENQVFVDRWVVGWCDRRGWPVLEAEEEKTFGVGQTLPCVAMGTYVG